VKRFRGGLVFEAQRRLYNSTLGLRVIKKKKEGKEGGSQPVSRGVGRQDRAAALRRGRAPEPGPPPPPADSPSPAERVFSQLILRRCTYEA